MLSAGTIGLIESGISKLITANNGNVNDLRIGNAKYPEHQALPYAIYVIYIGITEFGQFKVRHYLRKLATEIPQTQVEFHITEIAQMARDDLLGQPVTIGDPGLQPFGLHDIVWRHKSYVAVLVDSRHWDLLNNANQPAIVFNTNKGSTANHTFFDAQKLPITLAPQAGDLQDTGRRWAIYFVNHMKKNDYGDDIGRKPNGSKRTEVEKFIFDIYFEVAGVDGTKTVVIVDPDGGNEGPPIGPP
jgi:hypothetical protein